MVAQRKVWVTWREKRQKWEVGFHWDGYNTAIRKYSCELVPGKKISFTKENRHIAEQYADYIRGLMVPDPQTGIVRFDPAKLSKVRKSRYAFRRYADLWIKEYENRALSQDVSYQYIDLLRAYLDNHILPILGNISIYEIDTFTIKDFYFGLSIKKNVNGKTYSKKQVQNIMDAFSSLMRSASDIFQGLDMPKFPKYREKRRIKINKFLLREDQDKVISFVEPPHKTIAKVYLYYGLRQQEVINLRRKDLIFLKDGGRYPALQVKTIKGGPDRIIEVDQGVFIEIMKIPPATCGYLFHFRGKPYYFKTFQKIIRRALDRVGFPDVRPHDASRHSVGSQMALAGESAFRIKYYLGHADIRTSELYVHMLPRGKERVEGDGNHFSKVN